MIAATGSLSGLIFFQFRWVQEAISVKESNFDISVSNALQKVVSEIEHKEAINIFLSSMPGDSVNKNVYIPLKKKLPLKNNADNNNTDTQSPIENESIQIKALDLTTAPSLGVFFSDAPWGIGGVAITEMKEESLAEVAGLRIGDIIVAVNDTTVTKASDLMGKLQTFIWGDTLKITYRRPPPQLYVSYNNSRKDSMLFEMVKKRLNVEDGGQFSEPRAISNADIVEKLSQNYQKNYDKMQEVAYELTYREQTLQDRIKQSELEGMLQKALNEFSLHLDYEYCLLSAKSHEIVYPEPCIPNHQLLTSPYSKPIYYEDFFSQPGELKIYFPTRRKFLFQSSFFMLLSSFLLNLVIVGIVAYTFYVIFRQKKLSEMKTDFINNMTHELKTPISTIQLASEMLTDNTLASTPKNVQRYANIIREENQRLQSHVEKVLQFAKTERGTLKLNIEKFDFNELIEEVILKSTLRIDKEGGTLQTQLNAQNTYIEGDRMHLINVLYNLIDNAIKYSNGKPHIEIYAHNSDGQLIVSIKDDGIGMTKEALKKIFEKFYRVPTGNIHNVKGFGLGLAYAKLIIQAHNGQISATSRPGKGSIFKFVLPNVV